MIDQLKALYQRKPLMVIILVGLILRLVATVYSKGYAMTDDHFKIIAEAGYKIHDKPSTFWTPNFKEKKSKRSMLYPYAVYGLINGLQSIGVKDPQSIMMVNRLFHALFSLLIIYLSYYIALLLSTAWAARMTAWIAAIFWFLPMMSVRNLIELVCIPFLMGGTYLVLKGYYNLGKKRLFFWAGVLLSISFTIRYQSVFFSAGLGIYLLFKKEWKASALLLLGFLLPIIPNHYVIESVIFDFKPFEKLINYFDYNMEHKLEYVTGPWYQFIALFLGIFIPPFSLLLAWGMIESRKKYMILLFPFLLFIFFHSWFPGKQERFILPVLMFFPMLGLMGYEELRGRINFFQKRPNFFRNSWRAFLVINCILLIPITLTYSKRSRVEAMYYIKDEPTENKNTLVFGAGRVRDVSLMPVFYTQYDEYPTYYEISSVLEADTLVNELSQLNSKYQVDYVFMVVHDGMDKKLERLSDLYELEYQAFIEASFIDKLMHRLNPRNKNYNIKVYKVTGIRDDFEPSFESTTL